MRIERRERVETADEIFRSAFRLFILFSRSFSALVVEIEDCFKLQSALVIIRGDEDGKLGYT